MSIHSTNIERSEAILDFFRTHPFISCSAVANSVGYDHSALSKLVNKTGRLVSIPSKYLNSFESVLKEYGFNSK